MEVDGRKKNEALQMVALRDEESFLKGNNRAIERDLNMGLLQS
jgi:hypothetical protein